MSASPEALKGSSGIEFGQIPEEVEIFNSKCHDAPTIYSPNADQLSLGLNDSIISHHSFMRRVPFVGVAVPGRTAGRSR